MAWGGVIFLKFFIYLFIYFKSSHIRQKFSQKVPRSIWFRSSFFMRLTVFWCLMCVFLFCLVGASRSLASPSRISLSHLVPHAYARFLLHVWLPHSNFSLSHTHYHPLRLLLGSRKPTGVHYREQSTYVTGGPRSHLMFRGVRRFIQSLFSSLHRGR